MHIKGRSLDLGVVTGFREVLEKGVKVEPWLLALITRSKVEQQCENAFLGQATWTHPFPANGRAGVCTKHESGKRPLEVESTGLGRMS